MTKRRYMADALDSFIQNAQRHDFPLWPGVMITFPYLARFCWLTRIHCLRINLPPSRFDLIYLYLFAMSHSNVCPPFFYESTLNSWKFSFIIFFNGAFLIRIIFHTVVLLNINIQFGFAGPPKAFACDWWRPQTIARSVVFASAFTISVGFE